MLRDKQQRSEEQIRGRLQEWTDQVKASGIAELAAFAVKLLQDMEAVVGAMVIPYSQPNRAKDKQAQAHQAFDVRAG